MILSNVVICSICASNLALFTSFLFSGVSRNTNGSSWRSRDRLSGYSGSCSKKGPTLFHCSNSNKSHGLQTKNNCTTTKTQSTPVTNRPGLKRYREIFLRLSCDLYCLGLGENIDFLINHNLSLNDPSIGS